MTVLNKLERTMTIINTKSELGGMEYPFLTEFENWEIETSDFIEAAAPHSGTLTLRWVKDNKVTDLRIVGQDGDEFITPETFCDATGLQFNIAKKGPFVLSKRISRIMRPYRFWEFRNTEQVKIHLDPTIDKMAWDGCAAISREYLKGMSIRYMTHKSYLPTHELDAHLKELDSCERWEITIMHAGGQEKAHAIVVDSLFDQAGYEVDFIIPSGATKSEVTLDGRVFIGLHPVHGRDDMRLDIQSLINLHPFFETSKLVAWLAQEADLFLNRIETGQLDVLLSRIENINSVNQLHELRNWYIGEYIASGGKLMWFPATVKAMGRQFLRRLNHGQSNFRFPIPGGRYYIFPDTVGNRYLEPGQIEIDKQTGTAWVCQKDWDDYIVNVLGGCDGDDALWIFQFTDYDGSKKVLAWRSPNQLGEYVLLEPTEKCHAISWQIVGGEISWPRMDSRKLPKRIDAVDYSYGTLEEFETDDAPHKYTAAGMTPAIEQAMNNEGKLGAYCNALMVLKSVRGTLPLELPARLEDVIDGSVKSPVDLWPVENWIHLMMQDIIADTYDEVPECLLPRILPALTKEDAAIIRISDNHWLTSLMDMVAHQIEIYEANLKILSQLTEIPLTIFKNGMAWEENGKPLVSAYQQTLRKDGPEAAQLRLLDMMAGQHSEALIGAASYIYNRELSDAALWLPDPKMDDGVLGPRQPGTAKLFIYCLRQIGLIGDPVWTSEGTVLYFNDDEPTGTPIQLNAVWFNWLKLNNADWSNCTAMSKVPKPLRELAKSEVAASNYEGMTLTTRITDNGRIAAFDDNNQLFAFVKPGQEARLLTSDSWRIELADGDDGNLHAVVRQA